MNTKRSWFVITAVLIFILLGVVAASFFMRGYRPDIKNRILTGTGLLVANSVPKGASVFINNKLVTATDDTLNLAPDSYQVKIIKDGFLPWEKTIQIKKEVVKQTEAHLFRNAPDLKPITATDAINPILSPDGTKVVFSVASASAQTKNGVWIQDLTNQPLSIARNSNWQLVRNAVGYDWSKAQFVWTPDAKQVLVYFLDAENEITNAYLLPADRLTPVDQLKDISLNLESILSGWQLEKNVQLEAKLKTLPEPFYQIATQSATLITFSPNEERLFYLATQSAIIPENLLPHPPARSDQPEKRKIEPGKVYVYDLKEDTNFLLGGAEEMGIDLERLKPKEALADQLANFGYQPIYWLATSRHIVFIEENKIKVKEYDGNNKQTLFAGPFENSFAYPWPDGNRLLILTSLYSDLPPNLYAVTIK